MAIALCPRIALLTRTRSATHTCSHPHAHTLIAGTSGAAAAAAAAAAGASGGGASGEEGEQSAGDEGEAEAEDYEAREPQTMHRLCPNYASDINSPLRCGVTPLVWSVLRFVF